MAPISARCQAPATAATAAAPANDESPHPQSQTAPALSADAAHEYDGVKRDILAWKSKVKAGGVLAGHDAQHPPVMKAVEELLPGAAVMHPCWIQPL